MPATAPSPLLLPAFEWRTAAGRAVRVRATPASGRPVLLLTNAWPQTIRCWDAQWADLAAHHDLVAVDLPGFLVSPGEPAIMRPSAQADFLAALIDEWFDAPPVLVAPDVGVPIGLSLAARYPAALAGLVVFDGPSQSPADLTPAARSAATSAMSRRVLNYFGAPFTLAALAGGYRNRAGRPPWHIAREYVRAAASPTRFGLTLRFLESYPDELPRIAATLVQIQTPTLVTWGPKDPFVRAVSGRALADRLPNATWQPLDGASHYAHEDAGERFTTLLLDWLAAEVPGHAH